MKKLFLIFAVLIGALIGLIFFVAIPKAEKDISAHLQNFGFKNAQIKKTTIGLKGISIEQIILGLNGQSTIDGLQINLNWLSYLFQGQIESIAIKTLNLNNATKNIRSLLSYKKKISLKKISAIPTQKIEIHKALWNTTTPHGTVRFEASALIQKEENNSHRLTASLIAQEPLLSFQSQWSGLIDQENNIQIEGTFNDFGMAYGQTQLNRGTGWLTYQETDGNASLAGQIEAGSGKILSLPVNNIALIIGQEKNYYPILLRAQASGIPNVRLTMDLHYASKIENQSFESTLSIKRPAAFFNYLTSQNILHNKIDSTTYDKIPTALSLTYLSEKRFADGPLPFSIKMEQNREKTLDGTFLIYPDSLDIRGTAESSADLITLIQSLIPIKDENISDDIIRIDGNLKSLTQRAN